MRGDVLRDADHRPDAGVDGLVDRVGREAGGHEDQARVRTGLLDGLRDGVEDGDALDVLAALAGRDAGDEVRPVGAVAQAVEAALAAGEALDEEARLAVDDDRQAYGSWSRSRRWSAEGEL